MNRATREAAQRAREHELAARVGAIPDSVKELILAKREVQTAVARRDYARAALAELIQLRREGRLRLKISSRLQLRRTIAAARRRLLEERVAVADAVSRVLRCDFTEPNPFTAPAPPGGADILVPDSRLVGLDGSPVIPQ